MKNITLSADEKLIASARAYAQAHGTTLNDLIRDYLKIVTGQRDPKEVAKEFVRLAREASGVLGGGLAVQSRRNPQAGELDVTKVFLDTNILVYAIDQRDPTKHEQAIEAVKRHIRDGTGVISTQVLQEFASVALPNCTRPSKHSCGALGVGSDGNRARSHRRWSAGHWNCRPAPDQLLGRGDSCRRRSRAVHGCGPRTLCPARGMACSKWKTR